MERARMAPGTKEAGTIGIRWTACPQEEDVVVELYESENIHQNTILN